MVNIRNIINFLKKKNNEVEKDLKTFKKIEKDLSKKSKILDKGKTMEENIKFIDHLKIALQFSSPSNISHIKVEINE